jgi:hypothetical protein
MPIIQTPEFLRDRAMEINTSLTQFNDDLIQQMHAGKLSSDAPKVRAWRAFRDRWLAWYSQANWWTWAWGATNETLNAYGSNMADWSRWYLRAFGEVPTGAPPTNYGGDGRSLPAVLPWVLGTAAAVGIGIAIFKR